MTFLESNVMHKYKTNKILMEDLWIGVDIPDDPKTRKIKKIRDNITFKEENKRKLIENGFISKVKFDSGKSEIAVNCEILCIISGLFCDENHEKDKNVNEDKVKKVNIVFKRERFQLQNIIPQILNHLSTLVYPFTRHDISIIRSLKNIILNLKYEIKPQEIQFFIDLLLLHKNTPSVYALKNEIINLFTGILKYKDIRDQISSKKVIYILNNPNLNTISLLNLLISPSTYQWIKINHVFNSKNKAFSLVVKWFLYGEGKAFKTVIDFFTEYIFVDKTSLYYFGQVVHENVEAQIYTRECGLLEKICNRYDQEVDEGVVYVITNLVDTFESNRKYVAESNVLLQVFEIFKMKCLRKEYDGIFKEILQFFQVMTRSVLFLRTHLLDYPIIEFLFDVLDNCGNEDGEREVDDSEVGKVLNQNQHHQTVNHNHQTNAPYQQTNAPYQHSNTSDSSNLTKTILKLIVNLVLDYGNYKKKFVENGGFDKILKHKQTYPIEVLMIFKNFLYDTHWQAKEQFLSSTNPDFLNFFFKIYETSKDPRVIEILFNLIRNLVCDDSLELILVTYTDLIPKVFKYLGKFSEEKNEKVLIQILYTIGNLSANSPAFRDLIFEGKRMDFLKDSCTTRDLSLAFVWIIINVSWKDNGFEERVNKLKEFGIKEFLLKMTSDDSVLMDKINTALDNIK